MDKKSNDNNFLNNLKNLLKFKENLKNSEIMIFSAFVGYFSKNGINLDQEKLIEVEKIVKKISNDSESDEEKVIVAYDTLNNYLNNSSTNDEKHQNQESEKETPSQNNNFQLSQSSKPKEDDSDLMECVICSDQFHLLSNTNAFLQCDCIIHGECFIEHLVEQINSRSFPLACPFFHCKKPISIYVVQKFLSGKPDMLEKLEKFTLDNYRNENLDNVSCCPTPGCEYVFFFEKGDSPQFQCQVCRKHYCLNCKVNYHFGVDCEEFSKYSDKTHLDSMFQKFVQGQKFKQCPKCNFWVEKTIGCNHIRCRCKHEFCYVCGVSWKKGKAQCTCALM